MAEQALIHEIEISRAGRYQDVDLANPDACIDHEPSLLAVNERVLEQA